MGHPLFVKCGADFIHPKLLQSDTTGVERSFLTTRVSGEFVHESELEVTNGMIYVGKVLFDGALEKQRIAGVCSADILTKANSRPASFTDALSVATSAVHNVDNVAALASKVLPDWKIWTVSEGLENRSFLHVPA